MEEEVKYCKNCKRDISAKNYVIHTVHCERKIQLCDRCLEPVPRSELEKHEEEYHSKDTCSECGISVEKWQVEKHKEICVKKLVPCEYCELEVPLDNLSEHTATCGSRTEQCSKCNKHVMLKDLEKHPRYCSRKEPETLPCEHCGFQIDWNELMEHTVLCGTRSERGFLCNEHVMLKDRDIQLVTCEKALNFNEDVSCDYCGGSFSNSSIRRHVEFCRSQAKKCDKCNSHIQRKDMGALNFNEGISCEYCGGSFSNSSIGRHVEFCRSRAEKCDKCNCYIQRKDMEFHLAVCKQIDGVLSTDVKNYDETEKSNSNDLRALSAESSPMVDSPKSCFNREIGAVGAERTERKRIMHSRKDVDVNKDFEEISVQKSMKQLRPKFPCKFCGELYLSDFLEDHADICGTRTQKYEKRDKNIPLKTLETHANICEEKRQLRLKVSNPCKYCGKLFPSALLEDHANICRSRNQKCEKCDKYIPLNNMEIHLNTCKEMKQLRSKFPCKYCGELYLSDFLEDHADICGTQTQKCEKCDKNIPLKNLEMHSNVCEENSAAFRDQTPCIYCEDLFPYNILEHHATVCRSQTEKCRKFIHLNEIEGHQSVLEKSMSKTYGKCPICHQSIPWIEMNVHCAFCAQVNSDTHEYERQNQFNERALRKESEAFTNKISDGKKSQLDEVQKRCSFCFENFPCNHFAQHLKDCQERPYNCNECLKAMPYRKKEEHELSCLGRRTKTHADDYMLHDEETDDNKELKKFKKCQFCDLRCPDVLFQHHLEVCEHREEKCTVCLENVPLKIMHDHRLLKCNFTRLAENKNLNSHNNTYAEAIPEPSKNFERMGYLEEIVETCPLCKCKIPEERYHEHLLLCYNKETRCHFCGIKIFKKNEHSHFRDCYKILQIVEEDNNSQSKKKKGNINKGKSIAEYFTSWLNPSHKGKRFESNNTRQASQESYSWQSNRGQSFERDNITPVHPSTTGLNEVNELPCEFCNQMWPSELLIEHESGCRPDLVSFPKTNEGNEDYQKYTTAAATVSQISPAPVLDASPKSVREEDNEWKVQSRRRNQASIRETIDCRKKERNVPQKQFNAKEKFFYYPSQDTEEVPKTQPGSFKKKRYPQVKESQETSNTKPNKEIGVKKDDSKKDEFNSFRFSTSRFNKESQNASISRKENDGVLSTDVKNYDETEKSNSNDLRALSAESSPRVDSPKSCFNREIRAVGAERTERKQIMHSMKDVDVKKDFEEISVQKSITFDENNKSEPSKFLETTESRKFNLSMPAIWNTEGSLSNDKTLRSHLLKSFDNNYDNEAKDDALSNAAENTDHRGFNSSTQETDYDVKNNETFGSNFVESINNKQKEENENDTRSERSNSDDTFYDADDGSAKYFDTVNDNFHSSSNRQEEKLSHYDFDNLNLSSRNQKENVNPSSHEDLNADIRLEEEDLNQKDCDLDGYFQFLHKSLKRSDEAPQRMIGAVEKLSCRTTGYCKCGSKECCCELPSLMQKTSPQACSFKDASCKKSCSEPMDLEPLVAEARTSNQMKSKKSVEFSRGGKLEDENIDIDEAMKWKKWRVSEKKVVFSSDSE